MGAHLAESGLAGSGDLHDRTAVHDPSRSCMEARDVAQQHLTAVRAKLVPLHSDFDRLNDRLHSIPSGRSDRDGAVK
jgi:hypothetical protein